MTPAVHPSTGLLRPSSAPRWGVCAGSYRLEALYPEDEESPEAREGTAAHWWSSSALAGVYPAVGALAPNGHPIDAEMVEAGNLYVQNVREAMVGATERSVLRVETKVFMHNSVHPLNEGTPDLFYLDLGRGLLIIWDYKYGHRHVDVFENKQLTNYAAGIMEAFGLTHEEFAALRVVYRIVQPRSFRAEKIREWATTGANVLRLIGELAVKALQAVQPGAPTQTGEHCRDCNGRHACTALMAVAALAVDMAGQSTPYELTPAAIGLELKRLDMAQKRLAARQSGLEETAMALIRQGKLVQGWKIGNADTRERWNTPASEVFTMGDLMGVELRKAPEPVTPNEARKRGVDPTLVKAYAIQPTGAQKLVPVSETAAARAFGNQGTKT